MRQLRILSIGILVKTFLSLMTEEYLAERAKRGSREKFDAALAKVADIEPEEHDKL